MSTKLGLEVPAFGALAAISAVTLGATRIELNAAGSYVDGGLTPSIEDLHYFTSTSSQRCPLRIMIRPRGPPRKPASPEAGSVDERDFIYTDDELKSMEASIDEFKASGLLDVDKGDGFVFGILQESSPEENEDQGKSRQCWVDGTRCAHLVQAARPFKCVFHRAFDEVIGRKESDFCYVDRESWEAGLETIAACGFDGILTSGGPGKAADNIEMLERVLRKAQVLKIEIIIGGGVRTANVGEITRNLGLREGAGSVYLHSACLRGTGGEELDPKELQGILDQ
ncbi:hypothetical protein F4808DRAFT_410957 [Astrocystis sublimbata]|nr:hypothetical protein F4808DRAFT_410957 [Astrocystis sublimbata]